jgi:hypothetical protein
MLAGSRHDREMKRIERQRLEREANTWTDIAAPGSLIVRHHVNDYNVTSTPLHLSPGKVNGGPSAIKAAELERWALYTMANAQARAGSKALPAPEPVEHDQPLPPLLDLLYDAPRIALGGSSGAGKTTVAKMLMAEDMRRGKKVMFVSPHEESTIAGVPVVGVGRDYGSIAMILEALVLLMTKRYRDVATGQYAHFGHHPISCYIDEWTSVKNEVDDAGTMLGTLVTEARKVNMQLTVLTHSLKVDTLGINTDLRQSLTLAWLDGGEGQPFEAAIHKYGPTGKLEILPYQHPGYRQVILPDNDFVIDIPSPEIIKVQTLKATGASDTAVAKEIFGVKRPNSGHIAQVRQLYAGETL